MLQYGILAHSTPITAHLNCSAQCILAPSFDKFEILRLCSVYHQSLRLAIRGRIFQDISADDLFQGVFNALILPGGEYWLQVLIYLLVVVVCRR